MGRKRKGEEEGEDGESEDDEEIQIRPLLVTGLFTPCRFGGSQPSVCFLLLLCLCLCGWLSTLSPGWSTPFSLCTSEVHHPNLHSYRILTLSFFKTSSVTPRYYVSLTTNPCIHLARQLLPYTQ